MGRFMRLSRGFRSNHQSIFRLNLMGGKFAIYKGLQRPLVFRSFKGKFIYWGVGSLMAGLVLGALTMADIAIYAEPMVKQIVNYQGQIVGLAEKNPAGAALGLATEIEFVEKAEALTGYVTGLTLSIGDVNQMKASDRKLLFDYVIIQLSKLQELSGNLVNTLTYSNLNTLLRSINPFQSYIDADKSMAESIIQNAKYLKQ